MSKDKNSNNLNSCLLCPFKYNEAIRGERGLTNHHSVKEGGKGDFEGRGGWIYKKNVKIKYLNNNNNQIKCLTQNLKHTYVGGGGPCEGRRSGH